MGKRKETSVNLSKLLKETLESTWQCVIGDGSSSSKKTRGLIGLPNPEEELRLLEEKANETYGKYQDALQTTAGLEGQMGDLKDEIAAMSKQLSEEQGNISVYTDRQAKAIAVKGETEIELAAQQKVLADEEASRVELAAEVKSHAGSIGAVKKDMEDIELAILKVEQEVSALFPLLGLDLPEVELQLFSLENVSVSPAALAGPGGDRGEDATSHELISQSLLNHGSIF